MSKSSEGHGHSDIYRSKDVVLWNIVCKFEQICNEMIKLWPIIKFLWYDEDPQVMTITLSSKSQAKNGSALKSIPWLSKYSLYGQIITNLNFPKNCYLERPASFEIFAR